MKTLAYVYMLLLLSIVVIATSGQGALLRFVHAIPFGDKTAHFFLVGSAAFVVTWLLKFRTFKLGSHEIFWGVAGVFVFATCEEFSQSLIPTRSFDWGDMLANWLGIFFFAWLAHRYHRREHRPQVVDPAS